MWRLELDNDDIQDNLSKQPARNDAFAAVFEEVVENAAKELTERVIGTQPNTTGRAPGNCASIKVAYHS